MIDESIITKCVELLHAGEWACALVSALILQRAVRDVVAIGDATARDRPVERLPTFSLPSLDSGRAVHSDDMRGRAVTFVFVEGAKDARRVLPQDVVTSIAIFRQRTGGRVYLVSRSGSSDATGMPLDQLNQGMDLGVLVDRRRYLEKVFNVRETPAAVEFDAQGMFVKAGRMQRGSGRQ